MDDSQEYEIKFQETKKQLELLNLSKKKFDRKANILELLITQIKYRKKLQFLQNKYCNVMSECITKEEYIILFPNIPGLLQLSKEVIKQLKKLINGWDPQKTCLATTVKHLSQHFILYSQYYRMNKQMMQIIGEIRQRKMVKKIEEQTKTQLYNLLIQPHFRVNKYILVFQGYHKLLQKDHSDYQQLDQAINMFRHTMKKNNDIFKEEQNQKHAQQLIGKHPQACENQRLIWRETYQAKTEDQPCKIQVFTNLLQIKICQDGFLINLDQNSYVVKQSDGFNYVNKLFICGNDNTVHLIFTKQSQRNSLCSTIEELIKQFKKTLQQPIQKFRIVSFRVSNKIPWKDYCDRGQGLQKMIIEVKGYELKKYTNKNKYFILKYYLPSINVYQKVYFMIENLQQFQNTIRKIYPEILPQTSYFQKLLEEEDFEQNIETYFFLIERVMNQIIRNKVIQKRPQNIAYFLKMSQGIWNIISTNENFICNCTYCSKCEALTTVNQYYQIKKERLEKLKASNIKLCPLYSVSMQKSLAKINPKQHPQDFKTIDVRLNWINCWKNRIQHDLMNRIIRKDTYQFKVKLLNLNKEIKIEIEVNQTNLIQYVLQSVCRKLGLTIFADFCLCIKIDDFYQVIDNEEKAVDIILELQKILNESFLIFWGKGSEPQIYLKKMYNVEMGCQIQSCISDTRRYELLVNEYLYRLKMSQIHPDQDNLIRICADYYILSNFQAKNQQSLIKQLHKILPNSYNNFKKIASDIMQKLTLCRQSEDHRSLSTYARMFENFMISDQYSLCAFFYKVSKYNHNGKQMKFEIKIGVNYKKLVLVKENQIIKQFDIKSLEYISVGNKLQIKSGNQVYEMISDNNFTLTNQLQQYRIYCQYFL